MLTEEWADAIDIVLTVRATNRNTNNVEMENMGFIMT